MLMHKNRKERRHARTSFRSPKESWATEGYAHDLRGTNASFYHFVIVLKIPVGAQVIPSNEGATTPKVKTIYTPQAAFICFVCVLCKNVPGKRNPCRRQDQDKVLYPHSFMNPSCITTHIKEKKLLLNTFYVKNRTIGCSLTSG